MTMGSCASLEKYLEKHHVSKGDEKTGWFTLKGQKKYVKCVRINDVDTIVIVIRIHNTNYQMTCRLEGIDGAEMRSKLNYAYREEEKKVALQGKKTLEDMILNHVVYVHCGGWDKYGRLLGTIFLKPEDSVSINQKLIDLNLACKYDGKQKIPFHEWRKE